MTDFNKVRSYYQSFDEDNRLSKDGSGRLEFEQTVKILKRYLPSEAKILDLGGASGTYSFFLAEMGYDVWLADLSEHLINIAVEKNNVSKRKLQSLEVVNAVDLSIYPSETFDVLLLFGPLYHLTEYCERETCIREIYRVLKKNGLVFASFIPYLSGSRAIIDRYFEHSEQVNEQILVNVFQTGQFQNLSTCGFQEGYYPDSAEIQDLFLKIILIKLSLHPYVVLHTKKKNNYMRSRILRCMIK